MALSISMGTTLTAKGETPIAESSMPVARPGYQYVFPFDHGTHDDYRIEWWYFTGNVFTDSDRRFGFQLTFFRRGVANPMAQKNPSRWAIRQLYFAHAAVSDVENARLHLSEKVSREGLGKAGAHPGALDVWIDDWGARTAADDPFAVRLHADSEEFGIDLHVMDEKGPVIHGTDGVSRKGAMPGQASHYYSLTRLRTHGILRLGNKQFTVSGVSWMDHEFGSGELGANQVGWDWFGLQLDSGMELMIYFLRQENGQPDLASSGTVVFHDGQALHLPLHDIRIAIEDYWTSPVSQGRYPSRWMLRIPNFGISLSVVPVFLNQELVTKRSTAVTYWEGAVDARGQVKNVPVAGRGYVEMTGYAEPFRKAY